jgi:hypothetical protein
LLYYLLLLLLELIDEVIGQFQDDSHKRASY